jgi:hypothetical protein
MCAYLVWSDFVLDIGLDNNQDLLDCDRREVGIEQEFIDDSNVLLANFRRH